ncbi:MAG: glycogen synthase GlgA, partial [Clostridia bacterium]|nr:glycogen synthase GlgA [Clostridia bacterium]
MLSSEVAPYAKSGGLGDVLGALPQALKKLGHDVRVVLPKYGLIDEKYVSEMKFLFYMYIPLGWRNKYCGVFSLERKGVTYYFIDNEYYFGDSVLYRWDDLERFAFFDKACLEILTRIDFKPDVIHCNDWQTGMVPVVLKAYYDRGEFYQGIKTVFTIHNLKYQGIYSIDTVADFFSLEPSFFTDDKLEFHGCANLLKAGIVYSDVVTTVSPTYAEEIKTPLGGERLDGLLRARDNSLVGILNGIDYEEYNPKTDPYIAMNYSLRNVVEGKKQCKMALQTELGLPVDGDKPMIGLVSRLVDQKGLDIVAAAMEELMGFDIQLVILGTGEEKYENMFRHYAWCNSGKVSANITFSNELAHKIYAASDFFLMPSLFEPCGLGQIIAMAYGTIPIVRETGGLKDTVRPYNEYTGEGNGFSFYPADAHDLLFTLRRALHFYSDKTVWTKLVKNALKEDFSWKESAKKYEQI